MEWDGLFCYMDMDLLNFIIAALATWRVSNFIARESGPGDIGGFIRRIAGVNADGAPTNTLSEAIQCSWCNSFWLGLVFGLLLLLRPDIFPFVALPFALSAASIYFGDRVNGSR